MALVNEFTTWGFSLLVCERTVRRENTIRRGGEDSVRKSICWLFYHIYVMDFTLENRLSGGGGGAACRRGTPRGSDGGVRPAIPHPRRLNRGTTPCGPPSLSELPSLSLSQPLNTLLGCYLVQAPPMQMGRLRPGEANSAGAAPHTADPAGPRTHLSPHDPGSGLQISTAPSSFPSDFPCPLPRLPGTPVPPRLPIADCACSTSSMPSAHGHYVMIR